MLECSANSTFITQVMLYTHTHTHTHTHTASTTFITRTTRIIFTGGKLTPMYSKKTPAQKKNQKKIKKKSKDNKCCNEGKWSDYCRLNCDFCIGAKNVFSCYRVRCRLNCDFCRLNCDFWEFQPTSEAITGFAKKKSKKNFRLLRISAH